MYAWASRKFSLKLASLRMRNLNFLEISGIVFLTQTTFRAYRYTALVYEIICLFTYPFYAAKYGSLFPRAHLV